MAWMSPECDSPWVHMKKRCDWAEGHPLLSEYHDKEWGRIVRDDNKLFEFLVLESAQAGLSWLTILKKREKYRNAFADFDPVRVSKFGSREVRKLMRDAGIVRNKLKIEAAINNAKRFLEIQKEFGSFFNYLKTFTKKPIINNIKTLSNIPAKTELSDKISIDLKKRGFKFMGSTIVYAHLQAVGIVDDHLNDCFRKSKS